MSHSMTHVTCMTHYGLGWYGARRGVKMSYYHWVSHN